MVMQFINKLRFEIKWQTWRRSRIRSVFNFHLVLYTILLFLCGLTTSLNVFPCTSFGGLIDCEAKFQHGKLSFNEWLHQIKIQNISLDFITQIDLKRNDLESLPDRAFAIFSSVTKIDLSFNKLKSVGPAVFGGSAKVKELYLGHNELQTIPPLVPSVVRTVEFLKLSHNQISRVSGLPEEEAALRKLDLSNNDIEGIRVGDFPPGLLALQRLHLSSNKLEAVEVGAFSSLAGLQVLKLRRNKLTLLPKGFLSGLDNLVSVDLSENSLRTVLSLTFNELPALKALKLGKNRITSFEDGAFYGSSLQALELDHNRISEVREGWLYIRTLRRLSLTNNTIKVVTPGAWTHTSGLLKLNMSSNPLPRLSENMFASLTSLEVLDLSRCSLSQVHDKAFAGLPSLLTLQLQDNSLAMVIEDRAGGVFMELSGLMTLDLSHNNILVLPNGAFSSLEQLETLKLNANPLASLVQNPFEGLDHLETIEANTKLVMCDCWLSWLPDWLKSGPLVNQPSLTCGAPADLRGKDVSTLDPSQLLCSSENHAGPVITQQPESHNAIRGQNISLVCKVSVPVNTEVSVIWRNREKVVDAAKHVNVATFRPSQNLSLITTVINFLNISEADAGNYQCIIQTPLTAVYSERAELNVYVSPKFVKKPQDTIVERTRTVRLTCQATGVPSPKISWQKDGGDNFPAARERRIHFIPGEEAILIVNVDVSDQGVYSCRAAHPAGTIVANATLYVHEKAHVKEAMEPISNVKLHDNTVIWCKAEGAPWPKITWKKDGQPLGEDERYFFPARKQMLLIEGTRASDAGQYSCNVSNGLGFETSSTLLRVVTPTPTQDGSQGLPDGEIIPNPGGGSDEGNNKPDPKDKTKAKKKNNSGLDPSATTGVIVIAVVCCIVGTSLVWVLVIYHSRRRGRKPCACCCGGAQEEEEGRGPGYPWRRAPHNDYGVSETPLNSGLDETGLMMLDVSPVRTIDRERSTYPPLLHYDPATGNTSAALPPDPHPEKSSSGCSSSSSLLEGHHHHHPRTALHVFNPLEHEIEASDTQHEHEGEEPESEEEAPPPLPPPRSPHAHASCGVLQTFQPGPRQRGSDFGTWRAERRRTPPPPPAPCLGEEGGSSPGHSGALCNVHSSRSWHQLHALHTSSEPRPPLQRQMSEDASKLLGVTGREKHPSRHFSTGDGWKN